MAASNGSLVCCICKEESTTYICPGCSKYFCLGDLVEHHESLKPQFHEIEDQRNHFVEILNDYKNHLNNHPLVKQITRWERMSIEKIKKTAEEQHQLLQQSVHRYTRTIEVKLDSFTKAMQKTAKKKDFNEIVLKKLRTQLEELKKELNEPTDIQIEEDSSATYIKKLLITIKETQEESPTYLGQQLKCEGTACVKCGCCRDWCWRRRNNRKVYAKRDDATCTYTISDCDKIAAPDSTGLSSSWNNFSKPSHFPPDDLYDYGTITVHTYRNPPHRLCECQDNQI